MDKKKCTAIVLSAGQGKRMGTAIQKQYIELSGKPIIFYTLDAFQKSAIIDDIVLVVGEGQENWVRDCQGGSALDGDDFLQSHQWYNV